MSVDIRNTVYNRGISRSGGRHETKVNLKNTFIKHKFPLATFFISFIIMLIGFAVIEISPLVKTKSWRGQLASILSIFYKSCMINLDTENLSYSWRCRHGIKLLSHNGILRLQPTLLYYLSFFQRSTFENFSCWWPYSNRISWSFFTVYLKHTFKREDYTIVGFGLLYAFAAKCHGLLLNVMWLDAVALLPLIILGSYASSTVRIHIIYDNIGSGTDQQLLHRFFRLRVYSHLIICSLFEQDQRL